MKKATVLLLGLIGLVLLAWFCLGQRAPVIEQDLVSRTTQSLKDAGIVGVGVNISGREITLVGKVPTAEQKAEAETVAREVYGVRSVTNLMVVEPTPVAREPYEIELLLTEDAVILQGEVPHQVARDALVKKVKRQADGKTVHDRLQIRADAPAGWTDVVEAVVVTLGDFLELHASVGENEIRLSGTVPSEEVRARVEQSVTAALPAGYESHYAISVAEPPPATVAETVSVEEVAGCQQRFDELLSQERIHFETASARIREQSYPLLDELARAALECPSVAIRIEGHTDSRGEEEMNEKLSQERAEAVVRYLMARGVSAERLTAVGYGESRPVADNGTAAGRAKNRRIEFNVNVRGN